MSNLDQVKEKFLKYVSDKVLSSDVLDKQELNTLWQLFVIRENYLEEEQKLFSSISTSLEGDMSVARSNRIKADQELYDYVSQLNSETVKQETNSRGK